MGTSLPSGKCTLSDRKNQWRSRGNEPVSLEIARSGQPYWQGDNCIENSEGAVTLSCFYLSAGGLKPGSHPGGQWPQRSLMGTYVICSGMEIEANEIAESKRKRRQDVRGEDGGAVQHLGVKSKVRMWEMLWGRQKGDWNRQGLALIWMELLVSWRWRLDTQEE